MKKTLFLLSAFVFFASIYSQCYPVFKFLDKHPQFYITEASARNFPYFYRQSTFYFKNADSSSVNYGYYDGINWVKIEPQVIVGYSMNLLKWGNKILGAGRVSRINGIKAPAQSYFGVLECKSGIWDTIPGCVFDSLDYIEVCASANDLLVKIQNRTDSKKGSVLRYDTASNSFYKIFDYETNSSYNVNLLAGTNRIVLTKINKINNSSVNGFAYIENGNVTSYTGSGFTESLYYTIDKVTDHIFAMNLSSNPTVYEYGTSAYPPRKTYLSIGSPYNPLHVYNGQLIFMSYRGSSDNRSYNILCAGDTIWKIIQNPKHSGISLTNPYCAINGTYSHWNKDGVSKAVKLDNGALLEGVAFIDNDTNCNVDSGDHKLRNYQVYAESPSFMASSFTDDTGYFSMFVIEDTMKVYGTGNLSNCAGNNSLITQSLNTYQKNIPLKNPGKFDLKADLNLAPITRWNGIGGYSIIIENNGYPIDSADVTFIADSKSDITYMDDNFFSNTNNQAKGRIYNLDYYEKRWLYVGAWIDSAANKPDSTLCHKLIASTLHTESDYANNRDSGCQKVVYSYDPNHKECDKKKILPNVVTKLDYFIEFQNEGNGDAIDVVVTDALSTKLNWKTLQITAVSHPYSVEFSEGQLRFTFKNINLKPKKENEALSKGFIQFSISTIAGLQKGDSIQNNAYIYFDLNAPIITNMSVVKIDNVVSVDEPQIEISNQLKVYPNPANQSLNIISQTNAPVYIYNLLGELVMEIQTQDGYALVDISSLSEGIYIIRTGNSSAKLIKQN